MTFNLYSIKDEEMGFIPAIPLKNDAVARRWYKEYQHENLTMKLFPNNFELYYMGTFDSETGRIEQKEKPSKVAMNVDDRKELQDEIQNSI